MVYDATRFSVCDATRMRMNRHECIHEYTVTNRATPCGRFTNPYATPCGRVTNPCATL